MHSQRRFDSDYLIRLPFARRQWEIVHENFKAPHNCDQGCGSGYFVNRFRFQQSLDSITTWTLTEPGLYLIYELADKHDYQNHSLRFTRAYYWLN